MTKDELLAAIAATITTNGVKGITAESLANILTEMVNASGEGGVGSISIYQGETTLDDNGAVASFTQTDEQKAHNAEMFQILKTTSPMPMPCVDVSEMLSSQIGGSSVKGSAIIDNCMYLTEESAAVMGIEEECVVIGEGGAVSILTSDGTLTYMS